MAYLVDDRWFQSVFECWEFVHGPVQLRVMLASRYEDRQPHQPAPNAAFQRLETSHYGLQESGLTQTAI